MLMWMSGSVLAASSIPISSTLVFEMKSWEVTTDLGATAVNQLFATSKLLYRLCPACLSSHQEIFYQRVTSIPASFSIYSNVINSWTSTNNILNTNFKLFGSYSDYSSQQNAWQICNYDSGVGFPRDCGPTRLIVRQWNSYSFSIYSNASDYSFYIINPPPTGIATLSSNTALDANWIIQSLPAGNSFTAGSNAYVRIDPLSCGWGVNNSVTSKWIGATSSCASSVAQGNYVYQTIPGCSVYPSKQPTKQPTKQPSKQPTRRPSPQPSRRPSLQPIVLPANSMILVANSGLIAFNFSVSLNGGGSQCFAINAATASGQAKSIGVSFVTGSSTGWLSDFGVKFLLGSTQYIYSSNTCSGWTSLGSWPSSFNNYAPTSTRCNEMWSESSLSSLSAGFTEVCVVNTCGVCSC
eukprot:gene34640-44784_t